MEKEKWVNETLESLESIRPAIPPASMHKNIMQRLASEKFGIVRDTVSIQTVYRVAAAVAVIISLNTYSCIVFSKNQQEKKTEEAFAKEYSLTSSGTGLLNI